MICIHIMMLVSVKSAESIVHVKLTAYVYFGMAAWQTPSIFMTHGDVSCAGTSSPMIDVVLQKGKSLWNSLSPIARLWL